MRMIKRFFFILSKLSKRPIIRDTVIITTLSALGKTVGFLIPFFVAAWFGVNSETDAFFFAYGVILFLSGMFAPVLQSIIVPYVSELKAGNKDVGRFVGKVLGNTGLGVLILSVIFLLIFRLILPVITVFNKMTLNLVFHLLLEIAPLILLLIWTSILSGVMNAYKRFTIPALSPAIRALVNLVTIFSFKEILGIHSIALGYVVGESVRLLVLFLSVKQINSLKLSISIRPDNKIWEFAKTSFYQTFGMVAVLLNQVIDKIMACWLGEGSVSILQYAEILYMIPVTLISTGIMVTILSYWSSKYYESGLNDLRIGVKKTVKALIFITLPITLFLFLIREPLVGFLYGQGAFDSYRLNEVAWAWVGYLIGFIPYVLGQVYVRGHLVLKNTRVLMKCGFYIVFLNFLLNYVMMRPLKVAGIALATTFTSIFCTLYLGIYFFKEIKKKERKI